MKKIKIVVITLILFILCGCTNINKMSFDEIINTVLASNIDMSNQYRTGYKYYLPRGMSISNNEEYNEKINCGEYKYYLYMDLVSFYNKVQEEYTINKSAYYSTGIIYNNKYGYLEINSVNDKYIVEMMFNYAKIEVMVDEDALNKTVMNAMSILSSINYNEKIINNLMGENVLEFKETEVNIFETKGKESNTLKYYEEYGKYEEENTNNILDTDIIK